MRDRFHFPPVRPLSPPRGERAGVRGLAICPCGCGLRLIARPLTLTLSPRAGRGDEHAGVA